jgi:uncharacterized protein with HEPN domain
MLAMALTRCLGVLGEAASKVSPEISSKFRAIPFSKMISMRNRLIHAYFDVDLDIVWTPIEDDLPSLLVALDEALADIDPRVPHSPPAAGGGLVEESSRR